MEQIKTLREYIALAERRGAAISALVIEQEAQSARREAAEIVAQMRAQWRVMRQAAESGLQSVERSASGLVGGDAKKLYEYGLRPDSYAGGLAIRAAAYAVAVSEVNAAMGKIVACPTAGSCGILPGALLAAAEKRGFSEDEIVDALFTASGIGLVIAENASISGAEGGCQAECGTAAAMAAAALAQLGGAPPAAVGQAVALALKNLLGLVCDPVAGLVEVPCVKRNGFVAVHAVLAADMALAGVKSVIPVDEVVEAMRRIGCALPKSLRETSEAGLADAPTAREIERRLSPNGMRA